MVNDQEPTAFDRALGAELRTIRERRGLSAGQAVARLEKVTGEAIGARTLLTYELGARHITVARLVALARTYRVPSTRVLSDALHRMYAESSCPTCGRQP